MMEAIDIMQMIGVDYMLENGMEEALIKKEVITKDDLKLIKEGRFEEINVR